MATDAEAERVRSRRIRSDPSAVQPQPRPASRRGWESRPPAVPPQPASILARRPPPPRSARGLPARSGRDACAPSLRAPRPRLPPAPRCAARARSASCSRRSASLSGSESPITGELPVRTRRQPGSPRRVAVAILDIDGTLVDTNYHHTVAWYRAFRRHGIVLPLWRIHRHIGMGGDQLVGALTNEKTERGEGRRRSATTRSSSYMELIDEVEPMQGSRELIEDLKRAWPHGDPGQLGQGGRGRPLPGSARGPRAGRRLDHLRPTSRPPSPQPDLVHAALEHAGAGPTMP